MEFISKPFRRQQRAKEAKNVFPLFSLPLELRSRIYTFVGLPFYSPPKDYSGLYLSCKAVRKELDKELSREATFTLRDIRKGFSPELIVSTAQTSSFRDLSHISLSFPRWILDVDRLGEYDEYIEMLSNLASLASLYINTITIYIHDSDPLSPLAHTDYNSSAAPNTSGTQKEPIKTNPPIAKQTGHMYQQTTTYNDILPFAKRLTCLLCPQMCSNNHHALRPECCESWRYPWLFPQRHPIRVLNVIFEIRKLHRDPQSRTNFAPWVKSPLDEASTLLRLGWEITGDFDQKREWQVRLDRPHRYVWRRKRVAGLKKPVNKAVLSFEGRCRSMVSRYASDLAR